MKNKNRILTAIILNLAGISAAYAEACATAGGMRYNADQFEFCDNSLVWKTLSSIAAGDTIISGTTGVRTYQNTSATISTAGVERMVIGTNGNIGIGRQPDVTATLAVSGSAINLTNPSTISNTATTYALSSDIAAAGFSTFPSTYSPAWAGPNYVELAAYAGAEALQFRTSSGSHRPFIFKMGSSNTFEVARITSTSLSIGGITTPTATLDINNDNLIQPAIRITNPSNTVYTTLKSYHASGGITPVIFEINPIGGETDTSVVRLFRITSTTGVTSFDIHYGNNTTGVNTRLGGNGDSYINGFYGNVAVGHKLPEYTLDIQPSSSGKYIRVKDYDTTGEILIGDGTATANYYQPSIWGKPINAARSMLMVSDISSTQDTGTVPAMRFISRADGSAALATRPTFSFVNGPNTQMTILASGYVGIGTSTPSGGLHVVGDGGASDDVAFEANTDTANVSALLAFYRSRGTDSAKTAAVNGDLLGTIRFVGYNGTGYSTGATIASFADGNFNTAGTRNSFINFYTSNAGTHAEKMRLDPNGYLGILTTAPEGPLHVYSVPDITGPNVGGSLVIGGAAQMRIDNNEIQTSSGTASSSLALNPFGGNVTLGGGGAAAKSNLTVNGLATTCVIGNGTGATSCTSDRRLKTNIQPLPNALEKIALINGVSFDWKSSGRHSIGVIAQDVQRAYPEAVSQLDTKGDNMLTVDYAVLVAPLIQAVKELKSENDNLRSRLNAIEKKLATTR